MTDREIQKAELETLQMKRACDQFSEYFDGVLRIIKEFKFERQLREVAIFNAEESAKKVLKLARENCVLADLLDTKKDGQ